MTTCIVIDRMENLRNKTFGFKIKPIFKSGFYLGPKNSWCRFQAGHGLFHLH